MSAVLITGCAGAGKSAIATVLARRGLACIDDDEDPFLARSLTRPAPWQRAGRAGPCLALPAYLGLGSGLPRRTDPRRTRHAVPLRRADNQLELIDRFTHVFLLEIDEPTVLARLDTRQDNEWGRAGDSREYIRRLLPGYHDRMRAFGAIPIDRQAGPRSGGGRDTLPHAPDCQRAGPTSQALAPVVSLDPRNRQAPPEDDPSTISWT